MSSDGHEDDAEQADGDGGIAAREDEQVSLAEGRLESLAGDMSAVIEACPWREREALHDYAVSLVRESLSVAEAVPAGGMDAGESGAQEAAPRRSSNAATLIGYGVLLLPVGLLLWVVFRPMGTFLVLGGLMMIGFGLVATIVGKLLPKRTTAGDS